MEQPEDQESAWAGVLNGSMIALLGAVIPTFLLWQVYVRWNEVVSGGHSMTVLEAAQGVSALFLSALLIRFGARMVVRHIGWLRENHRK